MLGILSNASLPQAILLDTIAHSETGHLDGAERALATSRKGARGMYQFMPGNLHDLGYRMPRNIPLEDVLDPTRARQLADQYVTGYSDHHQFRTPLQKLVAYNAGPTFAAQWIAAGENISQLPKETQDYITRAAAYLTNQQGNQPMLMNDGYDDARRAFFTEEQIVDAKRRGVDAQGMIAMRDVAYATDPNKRRPDAMPSDIRESRIPTPQQIAAAQQRPNMMTRGGVDMNNPPGGGVTNDPNFGAFLQGRQGGTEITPSASIFDYSNIPPALQNDPQFGDFITGQQAANPAANPNDVAQAAANSAFPTGRTPADNAPAGTGIISSAQASQPPQTVANATALLSQLGQMQRSGVGANRRDQSAMSYKPVFDTNDLLIRMGSAAMRGAQTGGLEGLAAMGDAYSETKLANAKGLDAYNKLMADQNKKNKGSGTGGFGAIVVNDAIARSLPLIGNGWSTGFASFLNMIPGTEAQALKNNLATIKANIGFDKLQAMRDASPTGGALGQVSERELGFLQSVFGSLDQSQSAEELAYNIQLLQYVYNSIIHGEGNHPFQQPVYGAGGRWLPIAANLDAADAIVGIN